MDSVGVKSETKLSFDVDDFTHLPTRKKIQVQKPVQLLD